MRYDLAFQNVLRHDSEAVSAESGLRDLPSLPVSLEFGRTIYQQMDVTFEQAQKTAWVRFNSRTSRASPTRCWTTCCASGSRSAACSPPIGARTRR